MKRLSLLISLLMLVLLALLLSPTRASAQATVFGGGINITNVTTNSAILQTNTASVNVGRFYITYGGIGAGTNHLSGARQFSLDGTNFVTLTPLWIPKTTNGATETVDPATLSFPLYMRMSATTTTNISIGALYISPN